MNILHKFEQNTLAKSSLVNENFELVQQDIEREVSKLSGEVNNKIDTAKEDVLKDIEAVKDSLDNFTEHPYIIKSSDESILPDYYRIWSDGFCVQGGSVKIKSTWLDLLIPYKNANFNAMCVNTEAIAYAPNATINGKEAGRIKFYCLRWTGGETTDPNTSLNVDWRTEGFVDLETLEEVLNEL